MASEIVSRLSLQPVDSEDFETMLALRIEAMRPSLERVGRFDPARARQRLHDAFDPPSMRHIVLDSHTRVGFITVRPEADALRLDHLYLRDGFQGRRIGHWAMAWLKAQAQEQQRDIVLTALVDSDANRFYLRHDFELQSQEGVDLHYRWHLPRQELLC